MTIPTIVLASLLNVKIDDILVIRNPATSAVA